MPLRLLPLLLLIPIALFAQEKGIRFENDLSWSAIQAKARAENKYIFMDCYTTWCGPCRYMAGTIFPQQEVGNYVNGKFVSVAVQLDTTSHDNAHVRGWYADAHDLAVKYGVRAYPTYLIFGPDGQIVHRLVGSTPTAQFFLDEIAGSFDSTKQYYTQLRQFDNGRRDSAFLRQLTQLCIGVYDQEHARPIGDLYLQTQTEDLYAPATLQIMDYCTTKTTDPFFSFYAGHRAAIDSVLGPGKAEFKLRAIFLNEGAGDKTPPDWATLRTRVATYFPANADELTMRIQVDYYHKKKDWANFDKKFTAYMKTYSGSMPDDVLNSLAWTTFEDCPDMTCVAGVLDAARRLKESPEPAYIDTYANILYKLGKKADAIALEEKAMRMAPETDRASFQQTIDKMKKNEKTWD